MNGNNIILLEPKYGLKTENKNLLSIEYVKKLHNRMFCDTWSWAGKFRQRQTNISVSSVYIMQELKILMDDVIFWQDNYTFPVREIAVPCIIDCFIHPFPKRER